MAALQSRTQTLIAGLRAQFAASAEAPAEAPHESPPPIQAPIDNRIEPARRPERRAPAAPRESLGSYSRRMVERVRADLRPTAARIYEALHRTACLVAAGRGYAAAVSTVTFAVPGDVIRAGLRIRHRSTFQRSVRELLELGLIERRGHVTTYCGRRIMDTTLWAVKMHPGRGKAPRLRYDELQRQDYRDLAADIEAGRTAWAALDAAGMADQDVMRQSITEEGDVNGTVVQMMQWTDTPGVKSPQSPMTVALGGPNDLETVLDVLSAPFGERARMVEAGARALQAAVGGRGRGYYRWLLWQALRLYDRTGRDVARVLYSAAVRVRGSLRDGDGLRSPGAVYTAQLQEAGVLQELQETPRYRVGRPLQA